MHSILFISVGIVTALAVILFVALKWGGKPQKVSKWEKAEIMKQLLARADQESAQRVYDVRVHRVDDSPVGTALYQNAGIGHLMQVK